MEIKIWPRRPEDHGGYLMMPMRKNIPKGKPGWKLIRCPVCNQECWERPLQKKLEAKGITAVCTGCALKKSVWPQSHA